MCKNIEETFFLPTKPRMIGFATEFGKRGVGDPTWS